MFEYFKLLVVSYSDYLFKKDENSHACRYLKDAGIIWSNSCECHLNYFLPLIQNKINTGENLKYAKLWPQSSLFSLLLATLNTILIYFLPTSNTREFNKVR